MLEIASLLSFKRGTVERKCSKALRIMRERASGQNFELLYRKVFCRFFFVLTFFSAHRVIPLEDVTIYIHEDYF